MFEQSVLLGISQSAAMSVTGLLQPDETLPSQRECLFYRSSGRRGTGAQRDRQERDVLRCAHHRVDVRPLTGIAALAAARTAQTDGRCTGRDRNVQVG